MTRKRGRGTPRLLRPASWAVARLERWQHRPGEPIEDVTMVTFDGSWEHGQHQEVRVPLATAEVRPLAHALLDAVPAESTAVDVGQVPRPDLADPSPPAAGAVAGVPSAGVREPRARSSPPARPGPPDRHAYVLDLLRQRLERYFHGRERAGAAFVEQALRRYQVPSIEDLPTAALASLFNQLQVAPRSLSTPQGDTPHDHTHPTGS